jgi:hypothetical protein
MRSKERKLTWIAIIRNLGSQITPFASRTFQYTKEQLGQAEDKVRVDYSFSAGPQTDRARTTDPAAP